MAIKKSARKSRATAVKAAAPRAAIKTKSSGQGHHLVSWLVIWTMYTCALVVSIAFLSRVDWKWLTAYAYEQTHQDEIAQEQLVNALEKSTCEMAATATAASTSTCSALGFTAPATTTRATTSTKTK